MSQVNLNLFPFLLFICLILHPKRPYQQTQLTTLLNHYTFPGTLYQPKPSQWRNMEENKRDKTVWLIRPTHQELLCQTSKQVHLDKDKSLFVVILFCYSLGAAGTYHYETCTEFPIIITFKCFLFSPFFGPLSMKWKDIMLSPMFSVCLSTELLEKFISGSL